ncbi:MAG: type VI secretion system tip protein VgrG [Lysobacteraceae bacterium]|nr:MAG: type VI secretion system tip protein VgrG [Xanthomonadaceae bacterium]
MPPTFSTANRMYFLTLAEYGEDDLLIEEMSGHESLSDLFHFSFRLVSQRRDIDPRKIIGNWAKLRIETFDTRTHGGERHWSGFVSRFHRTGQTASADGNELYTYECDLVPWLWFMTRHQDIRIFQNQSIPDIIELVLELAGFSDYELKLSETHPKLLYCTQYHETNYAFISRLMQRAGIYTYYKHNQAGSHEAQHVLVFTDNVNDNQDMEPSQVKFHHEAMASGGDGITTLQADFSMRTGKITVRDWDFVRKAVVEANTPTCIPIGGNEVYERYHYPGGYVEAQLGEYFTKVMMQAEEAAFLTLAGESEVRQLEPGYRFTLEDHHFRSFNREYMVVSVDHYGRNNLTNEAGPSGYHNRFTVQPHDVPYRCPPLTPQPRVHGPQTAIVTGPPGDEIHTDEHGRIKVKFPWDRNSITDDKSSCWVRVAQAWAGNGYGTMFIPRVGMEVVVNFLEGDPDQPIVTGCVYNGINKTPYELPTDATKSTIKTLSSKGGGGFNELRFEDKAGSEEIFLHAQKDLQHRVKEKSTSFVGKDMHALVNENRYEKTVLDAHQTTDGKRLAYVRQDDHLKVDGSILHESTGAMNLSAGQDLLGAGSMNLYLKAGINAVLEAGTSISLKAGGSFINIGPAGVAISGTMVLINSGGAALSATTPSKPEKAKEPEEAAKAELGRMTDPAQQMQAQALRNAALAGEPFCAECAAARRAYEALMA